MLTLTSLNINLKNSEDIVNAISILTKNIQDTIQTSSTTYPAQERAHSA